MEEIRMNEIELGNSVSGRVAALHSQEVFYAMLRHERARANRDGSEFSLAVFNLSDTRAKSQKMKHIVGRIRHKMRSIDEIGLLDGQNIGVLLPATNLKGGQKFPARVSESVSAARGSIPSAVYTYPAHWLSGGNGGSKPDCLASSALLDRAFCLKVPAWKRSMDVIGSLGLIAFLSPVFFLIAVFIKVVSPGKVLFRQQRVGYQGKLFTFLKFRTMRENNDSSAHKNHLKQLIGGSMPMEKLDVGDDPRIIPGGKVLRKACMDELPQLFNVLRGEMSLVGPRPCIPYEAEEFQRWHTHRFDILPGMTGLWQVSGKNKLSFAQMIRFDIAYAEKMSPLLDMKILALTLPTIVGLVFEAGVRKLRKKSLPSSHELLYQRGEKETLGNA